MIILGLNEEKSEPYTNTEMSEPYKGFWRRQFQKESTESQKTFDWLLGVILPVACFVFDPTVFKGGVFGGAILGHIKPFAYVLSFVSVMAMAAWLIWGKRLKWLNAFVAGLFAVGGVISLGIGIVILPYSLLGLLLLIGVLGFTPFLTSIVFLRNALRAFHSAKPFLETKTLIHAFALSLLLSAVVPYVFNASIKNSLDRIARGDAATIRGEAQYLQLVAPLVNFESLPRQYYGEANRERKTALAEVYENLTGENIERKAHILMD